MLLPIFRFFALDVDISETSPRIRSRRNGDGRFVLQEDFGAFFGDLLERIGAEGVPYLFRSGPRFSGNGFFDRNLLFVLLRREHDRASVAKLVRHCGFEKPEEFLFRNESPRAPLELAIGEKSEHFRGGEKDAVIRIYPTARYLHERFQRMRRGFLRSESFADIRERIGAEEENAPGSRHGEMQAVFLDRGDGAVQFPDPAGLSVLHELGKRHVHLMERRFETLDGTPPRVREIFLSDGRNEYVDDEPG